MRRLINNRMYPTVEGSFRRMVDPEDVVGVKDNKLYLKSRGWLPMTPIKVGYVLEYQTMLYCDFDVFDADKDKLTKIKKGLYTYWLLDKVNVTDGNANYTYYMALQKGTAPYLVAVDSSNTIQSAIRCGIFQTNKYGQCVIVPSYAAANTPWTVVEVYSKCVKTITQFKVVKQDLALKKDMFIYFDTTAYGSDDTTIFITYNHRILWNHTEKKVYLDSTALSTTMDGSIAIFKPNIEDTVGGVTCLCYYKEA